MKTYRYTGRGGENLWSINLFIDLRRSHVMTYLPLVRKTHGWRIHWFGYVLCIDKP